MIRKITQEMRRRIFAARDFASNENDKPIAADAAPAEDRARIRFDTD
jgi:hypothetical protein